MLISELRLEDDTENEYMRPESVLRIKKALEEECSRKDLQSASVADLSRSASHATARNPLASRAMRLVACLVLALGVGVVWSVFPSHPGREGQGIEEAVANSPKRPFDRLEVVCAAGGIENTPQGPYYSVPISLFSGELPDGELEIRLEGAESVYLSDEPSESFSSPKGEDAVRVRASRSGEVELWLFSQVDVAPDQVREYMEGDQWDVREPVSLILRLRDAALSVADSEGNRITYKLDLDGIESGGDAGALVHSGLGYPDRPVVLSLVREERNGQ